MSRIRRCDNTKDFDAIYSIINEAALAYRNVIPVDRWKEPYMPRSELEHEIRAGVHFYGYEDSNGSLLGVIGIQDVRDVSLIRHAYVKTANQKQGIGTKLLSYLLEQTRKPLLVGTWRDAAWAIRFYEKYGFKRVPAKVKDQLLKTYWSIPERQVETSLVLADKSWILNHDALLSSQTEK